jgi:hypothetical protein
MTTGAPDFARTAEKRRTIKEIFKHLFVGAFGLCGMQPIEPLELVQDSGSKAKMSKNSH